MVLWGHGSWGHGSWGHGAWGHGSWGRGRGRIRLVEILKKTPTTKGAADTFTGDVYVDVVRRGEEPSRIRVNRVRFTPGARTAWHSHAMGQALHVIEGVGLVQSRGGEVVEMHPGDTIWTPADELHWHGATPDHFMAHLAMWEASGDPDTPETAWAEHVTDEEYNAR